MADQTMTGAVEGSARALLRLEGLALFAGALALYWQSGEGWKLFLILFLVPDLSMLGYIVGPRFGADAYNTAHSTIGGIAVTAAGLITGWHLLAAVGLIWLAHVGFDRALGFGLKYPTAFGDTHLGRIGKRRQ
jgi:hypothetical protein